MKRAATLGLAMVALAVPASASADTTATIVGANIDAAGTRVSVTNVQVKFDDCGGFDAFAGFLGCGAEAVVVPASTTCPANPDGAQVLWKEAPVAFGAGGSKTFNSGAKSVAVGAPSAYRVCAYSIDSNSGGTIISPSEIARLRADALTPTPTSPPPPDTKLDGSATAKNTQRQSGNKITVKAKVTAGEDLDASASGKVEVGKKSYKLKPRSKSVGSGSFTNLKLKPKKSKDAKKIAKALKKGKKAKAKLTVKLTDEAGNKKTENLKVRLKR